MEVIKEKGKNSKSFKQNNIRYFIKYPFNERNILIKFTLKHTFLVYLIQRKQIMACGF